MYPKAGGEKGSQMPCFLKITLAALLFLNIKINNYI